MGPTGAGTPELFGVQIGSTSLPEHWGKALGGASGGYTAAHKEIVEMLRQRSRPYFFSVPCSTFIAAAGIATLDLLETSGELLQRLRENTAYFRSEMVARHFEIPESDHPIVPIMIGDAVEAAAMADRLLSEESTCGRSPTQSCRAARQESELRCPRHTPAMILIRRLRHLRRCAGSSGKRWALYRHLDRTCGLANDLLT